MVYPCFVSSYKDNQGKGEIKLLSLNYFYRTIVNLNIISDNRKAYYNPEDLVLEFQNEFLKRCPELLENIMNPPYDTNIIYDKFNPYIIELLQKFAKNIMFWINSGCIWRTCKNVKLIFSK